MSRKFEKLFRSPYAVPNCLQITDEGLWIVDQITDRVALVDPVTPVDHYGVNKWIREIATESSNTSGLSYGDGALWLGANGPGTLWRPIRATDAQEGDILKVDPATGKTLARYPLPGGGGTHGLDYDHFEPGMIWLTTLKSQTLTKVRIADWSIQKVLDLPYNRAHGVVRVEDGVWVVFTSDRVIVKFNTETGKELDRVEVPKSEPEPHGLSIYGKDFLYCDATSGWVTKITL
ncbi:MAG: hypothetical protein U0350_22700 [Caldilineaceae bacterium]